MGKGSIDTKALRDDADIVNVLDAIGVECKVERGDIKVKNPFRNDSRYGSAHFWHRRFYDFADPENNGLDIVGFTWKHLGGDFREACEAVATASGLNIDDYTESFDKEGYKKRMQKKATIQSAKKIAKILGLDESAQRKEEYRYEQWSDRDIVAVIDGNDRTAANKAAASCGGRIMTITAFDLRRAPRDYHHPLFSKCWNAYMDRVQSGELPDTTYYVVYRDKKLFSLATLAIDDPAGYKQFVKFRINAELDEIKNQRTLLDQIQDKDQKKYYADLLNKHEKDVKSIKV